MSLTDYDINSVASRRISGNEAADGSGTEHRILVDAAGRIQVDVIGLPLAAGTATAANQVIIENTLTELEEALDSVGTDFLGTIPYGWNGAALNELWQFVASTWTVPNLDSDILLGTHALVSGRKDATTTLGISAYEALSLSDPDLDGFIGLMTHALMSGRIDANTTGGVTIDAAGHLQIDVVTAPSTAVTGTFWQVTQPISAAALPLPAGAATAAIQATIDTVLDNIKLDTEAIETAIELIDNVETPGDAVASPGAILETIPYLMGWDNTAGVWERLRTDGSGALKVSVA